MNLKGKKNQRDSWKEECSDEKFLFFSFDISPLSKFSVRGSIDHVSREIWLLTASDICWLTDSLTHWPRAISENMRAKIFFRMSKKSLGLAILFRLNFFPSERATSGNNITFALPPEKQGSECLSVCRCVCRYYSLKTVRGRNFHFLRFLPLYIYLSLLLLLLLVSSALACLLAAVQSVSPFPFLLNFLSLALFFFVHFFYFRDFEVALGMRAQNVWVSWIRRKRSNERSSRPEIETEKSLFATARRRWLKRRNSEFTAENSFEDA